MKIIKTDLLIIGGGLTGLTIAYLLRKSNLKVTIVEARNRVGGRIHTIYKESNASLEMGATWLGQKHNALGQLLQELNIGVFEQMMGNQAIYEHDAASAPELIPIPPNPEPSYRIEGGSSKLIHTLEKHLETNQIHTGEVVQALKKEDTFFSVTTNQQTYHAQMVVSTLPPFLLMNTVKFTPALPKELVETASKTHTWMGESIKVGLTYATPFWREKTGKIAIFSNAGPINEMYDHSNEKDNLYGLKGFVNNAYHSASKAQRLEAILRQLNKYFGAQVNDYLTYEETVWKDESFTSTPYNGYILPHANNGHPIYRQGYMDGQFFIAGSETAMHYPGYMDGAVQSAYYIHKQILKTLKYNKD